jgi:rubredoxin
MSDRPIEKTLAELAPSWNECRACGYVYEPAKGDQKNNIPPDTRFADLPSLWRCPVCGASKKVFIEIKATNVASGFEENLKYGLGVNNLTPGQKNLLIFGGLALGIIFFLSMYTLN